MLPWWIGLGVILAAVIYSGYRFTSPDCSQVGLFPEFIVLAVVPVVYLVLMRITLKNQADRERE